MERSGEKAVLLPQEAGQPDQLSRVTPRAAGGTFTLTVPVGLRDEAERRQLLMAGRRRRPQWHW